MRIRDPWLSELTRSKLSVRIWPKFWFKEVSVWTLLLSGLRLDWKFMSLKFPSVQPLSTWLATTSSNHQVHSCPWWPLLPNQMSVFWTWLLPQAVKHRISLSSWKTQAFWLQTTWRKSVSSHWTLTCTDWVFQTPLSRVKMVANCPICLRNSTVVCWTLPALASASLQETPKSRRRRPRKTLWGSVICRKNWFSLQLIASMRTQRLAATSCTQRVPFQFKRTSGLSTMLWRTAMSNSLRLA